MAKPVVWVSLLALVSCNSDPGGRPMVPKAGVPSPGGVNQNQNPLTVQFGAMEEDVLSTMPPQSFNLWALTDLWVGVQLDPMPPTAVLHITTYTPDGVPFHSYIGAYAIDPSANPQANSTETPMPIPTRRAYPFGNGTIMTYSISITGSDYVRQHIYGTWKALVAIEGMPERNTLATFDLVSQ